MSRELLILARVDSTRRGEIISVDKQWGREELNTDKFVIAEIDDDKTDFLATYETGEQSLDSDGLTVIKETAKKYSAPEALVNIILANNGRKTIVIGDLTDGNASN